MLTQISFLFLYKRVFTTAKPWFHQTLYVLGFFVIATCISCFFASLFFCTPFTYSWDKTIPGGHCNEVQNVYITHDVMTVVLDSCLVAAPIPIIWGLQMHTRAKLAVMGMFLLGSLSAFSPLPEQC